MEHQSASIFRKTVFNATVISSQVIAQGVKKITFKVHEPFLFLGWQYVWIEIPDMKTYDRRGNRRAFSILNLINEDNTIEIVARMSESGYKQSLFALKEQDMVRIHGPFGYSYMIHDDHIPQNIIMIAGGLGVAAFMRTIKTITLKSYPTKSFLFYINKNPEVTPFLSEIEEMKKNGNLFNYKVKYEHFSWYDFQELARTFSEKTEWWIAGPKDFVEEVYLELEKGGISIADMVFESNYPTQKTNITLEQINKQIDENNYFINAINNSSNHTVITDTEGTVLFANKAVEKITGYGHDEIIGNTPRLWGGMMTYEYYQSFWKNKLKGEQFQGEIINRRKNGELYYARAHISPILGKDNEVIGFIGNEEDITDIKTSENRLSIQYDIVAALETETFGPEFPLASMKLIAESQQWDFSSFWVYSDKDDLLHCRQTWTSNPALFENFEKITKETTLRKDQSLPGRVFQSGKSEWIQDILSVENSPRTTYAKNANLHTGFAFPIYVGNKCNGVFEFYSQDIRIVDNQLLKTYFVIGNQIGHAWQRHKQEEKIRKLILRSDLATQSAGIGIWEWNLNENRLIWNDGMFPLYGLKKLDYPDEYNFLDIRNKMIYAEDKEKLEKVPIDNSNGNTQLDTEFRVVWPDKQIHYLRSHAYIEYHKNGEPSRMIGINFDVTKEKKIEQEAVIDKVILSTIGEGLVVTDEKGRINMVNRAFERITGWTQQEVVGKDMLDVLPKVDEKGVLIPREKRNLHQIITSKMSISRSSTYAKTHCYILKNKSLLPIMGVVTPIIFKDQLIGAVQVFHDVSAEKAIDQMKDDFVSIASHELRTPLTAIDGLVSMILDGEYGAYPSELKQPLEDVNNASQRLIHLVNDLLSVSRIQAGRLKFNLSEFSLLPVVQSSIELLDPIAKQKGITLEVIQADLPMVFSDKEKVEQLLNNVAGNSLKFTDTGSIVVSMRIQNDLIIVSVIDTGIGMTIEDQSKLFGKFQQLETSQGRPPGTGLGLHISREMARKMGGDLWIEHSEVGKGSTFSFSIPIAGTERANNTKKDIEQEIDIQSKQKSN